MPSFSDLKSRVLPPVGVLFDEASRCYDAKAFRSARIMIWLCVAESLESKIREMANVDSVAGNAIRDIEKAKSNLFSVDETILNQAKLLGILDETEYRKMEYIRDMRSAAAHPSSADPTEEEIIASAVDAVDIVLSRPALLTHGYVKNLLNNVFTNYHYLSEDTTRARENGKQIGRRLKKDVMPSLIREYAIQLESCRTDPVQLSFYPQKVTFFSGILSEAIPLYASTWNIREMLERYPLVMAAILAEPKIWPCIDSQCQEQVLGHLLDPVIDGKKVSPDAVSILMVRGLNDSNKEFLNAEQKALLSTAISSAPVMTLKSAGIDTDILARKLIVALKTHNYYTQNPAIGDLRRIGPEAISKLDPSLQIELGRNILQSADGGAISSQKFIDTEVSNEAWSQSIIIGVLGENFVDDANKFRLKKVYLLETIRAVMSRTDQEAIIGVVAGLIASSTPKGIRCSEDYSEAISIVETMGSRTEPLIAAINQVAGQSS